MPASSAWLGCSFEEFEVSSFVNVGKKVACQKCLEDEFHQFIILSVELDVVSVGIGLDAVDVDAIPELSGGGATCCKSHYRA